MIKFILSLTIILLSRTIFAQSSCLESIKNGTFVHFSPDGETRIVRKKNRQTEYFGNGKIKSKVMWLSEDEYILEVKKKKNAEIAIVNIGSIIHVKITRCYQDYYDFTISLDNNGEIIEADARYYKR